MPKYYVIRVETQLLEVTYAVDAEDPVAAARAVREGNGDSINERYVETVDSRVSSVQTEGDDRELFIEARCAKCRKTGRMGVRIGDTHECEECQLKQGFEKVPEDLLVLIGEP